MSRRPFSGLAFWSLLAASTIAEAVEPPDPADAARIERKAVSLADHGHRAEADVLFRTAVDLDRKLLGDEHPGVAVDLADFAANLAAEGQLRDAERQADRAVTILRARRASALHGTDGPDAALTQAKAHLNHGDPLGYVFGAYLDIARDLAASGKGDSEALLSKAFMAAQDLIGSASAQAMAMAAARTAARSGPLADLLRDQQALTGRLIVIDRRLLAPGGDRAGLQARLHEDMVRLADINRRIGQDFPAYRAIISPLPIDIATVHSALRPDEALLFLIEHHGDLHAFAIGPGGSAWQRSRGVTKDIAKRMAALHCQVDMATCGHGDLGWLVPPTHAEAAGHRRYDLASAHALYAGLVAPVEGVLKGARTIYVVTAGFLGDLPLAMLPTAPPAPGSDDADPAVLQRTDWLGDRYAFVYLPAVAGLRLKTVRSQAQAGGLRFEGYGDPLLAALGKGMAVRRGGGLYRPASGAAIDVLGDRPVLADPARLRALPSLPGTRRELLSMATSIGAPEQSLHLQARATETELKHDRDLPGANIVVFATHGFLPGEIEGHDEPGLILTPPDRATIDDDGILTASEASQLSLDADLVILSACNTASAAGTAGPDRLSSLARGFLFAGAHALLASHWRVSDDATAALTVETLAFRRTHPGLSGARALQAAMRTVRTGRREDGATLPGWQAEWAHPGAWAAFSYIADHDD